MKTSKSTVIPPSSFVHGRFRRPLPGLTVAAVSLLSIPFAVEAGNITGSETLADFGTLLNQNDTTYVDPTVGGANVGPNACVPTAVAQGLSYLENYQVGLGNADPFTQTPNNVQAINDLASAMGTRQNSTTKSYGTTYPNRVNGTTSYLSATGANPSTAYVVGGQYDASYSALANIGATKQSTMQAVSTAQFLASALKSNDGVEFAILWGSLDTATDQYTEDEGGHFVTLQSINYNPTTGTGTIDFIDPDTAALIAGTLSKTTGGNLYVSYPGAPAAVPDFGEGDEEDSYGDYLDGGIPAGQKGGIISNDLAEAVPDGGLTALMLGGSVLGLLNLRRRYCFAG